SLAHDVIVHQSITANAVASAATDSTPYKHFLVTIASDYSSKKAAGMMKGGSGSEDDIDVDAGKKRSLNHFYDPVRKIGLTDWLDGRDSFFWASVSNATGLNIRQNLNSSNVWSWPNARGYEWLGLTSINASTRSANLDHMFRAVGQVMHLLQDTSQPQHVRNEQHLDYLFYAVNSPYHSDIEDYGEAHSQSLNYAHGMLDWKGIGFTKLRDFWDRNVYNTTNTQAQNSQVLNTDAAGGTQLGLAEFCNANFLGERALYKEFFKASDKHYFPFPSLLTSTTFPAVKARLTTATMTSILKNGTSVVRFGIGKTNDGIVVTNHSVLKYLASKFPKKLATTAGVASMTTINDQKVLAEYHAILIPKAVKYSTGLIDYFFRGQLGISPLASTNGTYYITITNASGQPFAGGAFHLFHDAADGVRTELIGADFSTDYSGTLASGGTVSASFNPPTNAVGYILVYQGTIGTTNGLALDPVDDRIAIAAAKIMVPPDPRPKTVFLLRMVSGWYGWNPADPPGALFGRDPAGIGGGVYTGPQGAFLQQDCDETYTTPEHDHDTMNWSPLTGVPSTSRSDHVSIVYTDHGYTIEEPGDPIGIFEPPFADMDTVEPYHLAASSFPYGGATGSWDLALSVPVQINDVIDSMQAVFYDDAANVARFAGMAPGDLKLLGFKDYPFPDFNELDLSTLDLTGYDGSIITVPNTSTPPYDFGYGGVPGGGGAYAASWHLFAQRGIQPGILMAQSRVPCSTSYVLVTWVLMDDGTHINPVCHEFGPPAGGYVIIPIPDLKTFPAIAGTMFYADWDLHPIVAGAVTRLLPGYTAASWAAAGQPF
ncbi:MAG: hypothetical protein JWR69_2624, partial [Pedosphaera sp.]|nr:hypothetical protein [Pedosphaera sp.]